jgi:hypothetical protein
MNEYNGNNGNDDNTSGFNGNGGNGNNNNHAYGNNNSNPKICENFGAGIHPLAEIFTFDDVSVFF